MFRFWKAIAVPHSEGIVAGRMAVHLYIELGVWARMEHGRSDLHRLFTEALKNASPDEAPILAWPLVCGPGVANRTRPMDFVGGVLRIQVPDKEWQAQLESLATDYLRAFGTLVEKKKVSRIEFVVPNLRRQEPLAG